MPAFACFSRIQKIMLVFFSAICLHVMESFVIRVSSLAILHVA